MQNIESLNMSISVLKSLLSDYALRANQAEAITGRLMSDKLDDQQFKALLHAMSEQMDVRSKERAVHQQALIQATIISLEAASKEDEAKFRASVVEVVKQLVTAQSHMNPSCK
jgi:hypothetical protein